MFLKKDGVTQNHKPIFIGMFLIILITTIMIIYRDTGRKEKIAIEQQKIHVQMTAAATAGIRIFQTPAPGSTMEPSRVNKDPEGAFATILSQNIDKKKILFFFASWNRESLVMLEDIKKISNILNNDTKIVAIEVESSNLESVNFANSKVQRIKCNDAKIPASFMVDAIPTIVVLGKNNVVTSTKKGSIGYEEILKLAN